MITCTIELIRALKKAERNTKELLNLRGMFVGKGLCGGELKCEGHGRTSVGES